MKILAIFLSPPVPATAGHRVRNRSLLRALAEEGHEVSLVAYASAGEIASPGREMANLCHDFLFLADPASSRGGRLRAILDPRPYGAIRLSSEAMRRAVEERLGGGQFDAILCDDCYMAGNIPEGNRLPVILNKHDITCCIVRQFARGERNLAKKLYAWLEAAKIERLESAICNRAEAVAVCSERDGEVVREMAPRARLFVAPNAIETEKFRYCDGRGCDPDSVVFVGAMDWLPNQDGAEFLVEEILPRLRRMVPTVQITLAGRNPTAEMRSRYESIPDVHLTGTVRDLRPIVARAAVCVVPLRIGSGTRLKILEAAAQGKAVVSTTLGAEGLDLRHGQEILLADDARQFAEAVALLLTDRDRAEAMGRAAQTRVEQLYGIAALRGHLRQMLEALPVHWAEVERAR